MKDVVLIYGECETAVSKKALELLSKIILDYTAKYPLCVRNGEEDMFANCFKIYVGTKKTNSYIKEHSKTKLSSREEYAISVQNQIAIIEGFDNCGVLYGCCDFYNKYIVKNEYVYNGGVFWTNPFEKDEMPDFFCQSKPAVENRGIWTWGHVIYDYKQFIDNMLRLKMNTIVIWNDHPPINAREMVDYAHASGIKVIWGYSWFWDTDCNKIDVKAVNDSIPEIFEKYEKEYMPLGGDGIYFQSFTELDQEEIGGVLIAEAVTDFVNAAASVFFEKYPNLELQFGLHASSVKEKLEYIKNVDSRVRIVWEDCGAFPFDYSPNVLDTFESTMELTEKITSLRGKNDSFGVVTKGMTKLDWGAFEHINAPVFVGVASKEMKSNRVLRKKATWRGVQSYWLTNSGYVQRAVKLMSDIKQGDLYITGLVEDGMFEENIMFPVALYSEILWDPDYDINKQINEVSLRNYVEFA